jgi:hypothetical protein
MNQFEVIVTELERDWPDWQFWYVPRAVGGTIWCARRWDDERQVINTDSPDALEDRLERQELEGWNEHH